MAKTTDTKVKAPKLNATDRIKTTVADFKGQPGRDEAERKDLYRTRHKGKKPVPLAYEQAEIEMARDYMKALLGLLNAELDVVRLELQPQAMEDAGLENFKVENLGRVSLTADMYVSIKEGCKDDLTAWLRKNRLSDLMQETINSSTLKAFVAQRMRDDKPIPTALLNVTPFTRASITRINGGTD